MAMTTEAIEARLTELLALPYRMEVRGTADDGYLATAPELPGCVSAGETPAEAIEMLRDAMAAWLESALTNGDPIPEPGEASAERYSGKFVVRLAKSLHRDLARQADREGVSLNQHVTALLAAGAARADLAPAAGSWDALRAVLESARAALAEAPGAAERRAAALRQ